MLSWILHLLFPPRCTLCRGFLRSNETDFCHRCRLDAPEFIKSKRRKKKIKKYSLITIVILVIGIVFLTKAPVFNITEINFNGNVVISNDSLASMVQDRIGSNIFTVNEKSIKETLKSNKYIKDVEISKNGISKLNIHIEEEAPVYYVLKDEKYLILNSDLKIIEEADNIDGKNLVKILGVDMDNIDNENNLTQVEAQKKILNEFYPYISENREELKLDSIDISNIVDIKGYMGNVEIFFGDESDLHNKMENVYRIM